MREATVTTHVGVVGEVLAADGAGKLVARGGRGRNGSGGGTKATGLGTVGLQRGTASVPAGTCVAPVGIEVDARVHPSQVDGELGIGGEVTRTEGTRTVRLGVLATDVFLEVARLCEATGAKRAGQSASAVDALVTASVGQRRKALVAFVT